MQKQKKMSNEWIVAKPKPKPKPKKKKLSLPIDMNPLDWETQFSELDKKIYELFKNCHPITLSPETILLQLESNVDIRDVWKSLDSKLMKKYLIQLNKFDWRLVTV